MNATCAAFGAADDDEDEDEDGEAVDMEGNASRACLTVSVPVGVHLPPLILTAWCLFRVRGERPVGHRRGRPLV